MTSSSLGRFLEAQGRDFDTALAEIKNGKKTTHWMWYIFPQIRGLGHSELAKYYAIKDRQEAEEFLKHPALSTRLLTICGALVELGGNDAHEVFGSPDDMKLRSCMTLFAAVSDRYPIFNTVLDQYFDGAADQQTLNILGINKHF